MSDSTTASPPLNSPPSDAGGALTGHVQPVAALTDEERGQMVALLERYFANVTPAQVAADLQEKESVILMTDRATGQLQGFSTLMRLHAVVDDQPLVAFFSGDTIIAHEYWGESILPRLWARHVFGQAALLPETPVYWFLISSGYKTYRFLPLFYREFYPACDRPTPSAMQRILDALARQKFPDEYDATRGIVRLAHATPLRSDVAEITPRRLRDPHVAFFVARNPGHAQGDELACLTRIHPENLTPAGRKMVGG